MEKVVQTLMSFYIELENWCSCIENFCRIEWVGTFGILDDWTDMLQNTEQDKLSPYSTKLQNFEPLKGLRWNIHDLSSLKLDVNILEYSEQSHW